MGLSRGAGFGSGWFASGFLFLGGKEGGVFFVEGEEEGYAFGLGFEAGAAVGGVHGVVEGLVGFDESGGGMERGS
jgi:hypothetical protein